MRVLEKGVCPRVIMTIIIIVLLDLHSVGLSLQQFPMSVTTLISISVMGNFVLYSPEYKFGTLIYPFHICCGVFSNKEMRVLEKDVCPGVITLNLFL